MNFFVDCKSFEYSNFRTNLLVNIKKASSRIFSILLIRLIVLLIVVIVVWSGVLSLAQQPDKHPLDELNHSEIKAVVAI